MRHWLLAAALAAGIAVSSVHAAGSSTVQVNGNVSYAIPAGSPVQFASVGQYEVVSFKGRFRLSGVYHYGYLSDDPAADSEYNVPELYFVPDPPYRPRLPYWQQRERVHELRIRNADAFAAAVIPAGLIAALKQKQQYSVSGRASIVVEGYQASIECDSAHYSVEFVSAGRLEQQLASRSFIDDYDC